VTKNTITGEGALFLLSDWAITHFEKKDWLTGPITALSKNTSTEKDLSHADETE
jgi:hypothetical protein